MLLDMKIDCKVVHVVIELTASEDSLANFVQSEV